MSSSPIKNVTVVGGTGNLGRVVVRELVDSGFAVTVLTRSGSSSTSTIPAGASSVAVDYGSVEALTSALAGQDAVVSTVTTLAAGGQIPLVDAALAAGVRRFVPSEFGMNTRFLGGHPVVTVLRAKIDTLNYIHEKAMQRPSFTWTALSTGMFFDWGLPHGSIGFDKATRTATIYDSGDEPFQATNLGDIAKAVAAVLRRPERTANRYMTVASFNPTQNQVLGIIEGLTGQKWTVHHVATAEEERVGAEKFAAGDVTGFTHYVRRRVYGDGAGSAVDGPDNGLDVLGVERGDLEGTIRTWLEA